PQGFVMEVHYLNTRAASAARFAFASSRFPGGRGEFGRSPHKSDWRFAAEEIPPSPRAAGERWPAAGAPSLLVFPVPGLARGLCSGARLPPRSAGESGDARRCVAHLGLHSG